METEVAVWIGSLATALVLIAIGLYAKPPSRLRRKRRALVEIFGADQLDGLRMFQVPFAYKAGVIEPRVRYEEMREICRRHGLGGLLPADTPTEETP